MQLSLCLPVWAQALLTKPLSRAGLKHLPLAKEPNERKINFQDFLFCNTLHRKKI